ncbi:MAG: hypothetical protein GY769_07880 [bacterium]|nr:hypothetical protein [bacterium]
MTKRSRCRHDRVYRERGPRTVLVDRLEFNDGKDPNLYLALVVVEVCLRCGRRREIPFLKGGAKSRE